MKSQAVETVDSETSASLRRLEERITRIEAHLGLLAPGPEFAPAETTIAEDTEEKLEIQLGQAWFARVGIVVLAIGIIFLLTFPYENLPPWLPSLFGYILVIVLSAVSRSWRATFPLLSGYLLGGALLLMYFTTMRLSYFSHAPAIHSEVAEVPLLLLSVTLSLAVAIRRSSVRLAAIILPLGFFTALLTSNSYAVFGILSLVSVAAVIISLRYGWNIVIVLGIALAYLTHTLWAINNPLGGNPMQFLKTPEGNIAFIMLYAIVYAAGTYQRLQGDREKPKEILASFMNALGAYTLLLVLTVAAFQVHMVLWHGVASGVFLALAVTFWVGRRSLYATFIYAMVGYGALSVAIISQFNPPDLFVWLCWQSVLVLSTAVWFQSRFIVVANFVIFVIIFVVYLFVAGTMTAASLSFGIVALVSARILNWQKERLDLRTELMRNAYLASALFIIPYALYHIVPSGFVSLSWLAVAATYYVFSRFLHLRKYRWMALLTMSMTIVYVFLIDLVGVNPTLRIVSFLALGTALIVVSMVYNRRKGRVREKVGAS